MKTTLRRAIILFMIATLATACSGMSTHATTPAASASNSSAPQPETYENPNYYYLFDDILVPNIMEHTPDDDFSFETDQFKAGIQNFEGRVVFDDLINFFQNNMIKDGWRKVTTVRFHKSILIFEKPSKAAIIELTDGFKAKAMVFAIEYKHGAHADSGTLLRQGTALAGSRNDAAPAGAAGGYKEKDIK